MATEELSRILERDITAETNMTEIIPKVQDKFRSVKNIVSFLPTMLVCISRYCEKRREVLIDHVREGYDNSVWKFYEVNPGADPEISLD